MTEPQGGAGGGENHEQDRPSPLRVPRAIVSLLVEAFKEWRRDNAVELGAALAYYTVFSLAPVLVIVIAIAGLAFGRDAAQGEIFTQFRGLIGAQGARALEGAVESASRPTSGLIATVFGVLLLGFGASGVFAQLQSSLNRIWNVPPPPKLRWKDFVRQRLLSFAMVLGAGFLLLVSLVVSAALAAVGRWIVEWQAELAVVVTIANELVSFLVITVLFAMMFKMLPDARIRWSDVWIGSAITAALFTLGKTVISLYVSGTQVGAAYGVAGSILIVLVWIYYSSQIFFFGAELTQVYAERFGGRLLPRGGVARSTADTPGPH